MENLGLAKSNPEKTIKEHTQDLLNQYEILKKIYPNILKQEDWEILQYAIKYHDLGKINTKFQNKLYKKLLKDLLVDEIEGEEIPHNFLSPYFIDTDEFEKKYGRENTQILVSSVYYHHDREKVRVAEEYLKDLENQMDALGDFLGMNLKINDSIARYIITEKNEELLKDKKYIMIKGFLNKLDYVASLNKQGVNVEEVCTDENGQTVADKIVKIIKEKHHNEYREVQKYMLKKQDENLIVISYTGSGKTEAALLWSGNQKVFYTLPLKVSINAIYERIKTKVKYKKALLLHSDAYSYYQEQKDVDINSYDRAKRLSAPLIVTTVDQLFKIAFRYQGYEEILSTLSYSKIIIDEIQMYSPKMLAYILFGLKLITDVGGKFAIITATFPPVLYNLMDYLQIPYTRQEEKFTPHISNRHKIKLLEEKEFDFEKIRKLAKNNKVLMIVNTVRRAQEIYEKLEKNANLLHGHFIKNDRKELEKKILDFGDRDVNSESGIWIATQIVEASLDIDFDILFTEMCSIDSLFQRMGRVFRKRNFLGTEPNVYILDNRNGVPYIIDSEIYDYTLNEIKNCKAPNLSEQSKQEMINNVFDLDKNTKLKKSKYYTTIKGKLNELKDIIPYKISKDIINKEFRDIQNISLMPDEIFDKLYQSGKIESWERILNNSKSKVSEKIMVKNEIQKYVINVTYNKTVLFDENELFYKGSGIYRTQYEYDFDSTTLEGKGLIMKNIVKNSGYFDE